MLLDVMNYLQEHRTCPHCAQELKLCHAPPVHVGDGLGWGSEYLFICLNDLCPLFVTGWEYIENQYGHVGSYRYMETPNSKENYTMMVVGKEAFTGSIIDIEALKQQDARYQEEQAAIAKLDYCLEEKNLEPVLRVLLNEAAKMEARKKALSLILPINDIACVEPLRTHVFRDPHLEHEVNLTISRLLAGQFLKECPYCAELIKARALVCKHCQKELAS